MIKIEFSPSISSMVKEEKSTKIQMTKEVDKFKGSIVESQPLRKVQEYKPDPNFTLNETRAQNQEPKLRSSDLSNKSD